MTLTFAVAALAACGVFLVLRAILESFLLPLPHEAVFHVVLLAGSVAQAEHRVKTCLWLRRSGEMSGTLLFVDGGLDADAQLAVHTLLRKERAAVLCAQSQLADYLKWEKETIGAGAD